MIFIPTSFTHLLTQVTPKVIPFPSAPCSDRRGRQCACCDQRGAAVEKGEVLSLKLTFLCVHICVCDYISIWMYICVYLHTHVYGSLFLVKYCQLHQMVSQNGFSMTFQWHVTFLSQWPWKGSLPFRLPDSVSNRCHDLPALRSASRYTHNTCID